LNIFFKKFLSENLKKNEKNVKQTNRPKRQRKRKTVGKLHSPTEEQVTNSLEISGLLRALPTTDKKRVF